MVEHNLEYLLSHPKDLIRLIRVLIRQGSKLKMKGRLFRMPRVHWRLTQEEVIQEIVLYILSHKSSYKPEFAPSTWICHICYHVLSRYQPRMVHQVTFTLAPEQFKGPPIREISLDDLNRTRGSEAESLLELLPPQERELWLERLSESPERYCDPVDKQLLIEALLQLDERQLQSLLYWASPSHTNDDLAAILGCTKQRVDQLSSAALLLLAKRLANRHMKKFIKTE